MANSAKGLQLNAHGGIGELEEERQEAFQARIYLPAPESSSEDLAASSNPTRDQLKLVAAALNSLITEYASAPPPQGAGGYIWNRDVPTVRLSPPSSQVRGATRDSQSSGASWLHLSTYARTGGALEDVHFITFILREATLRLRSLGLAISVSDEDGQFLLIEAADHLEDWINPENAEGRVWIFEGRLHIVSPTAEAKASEMGYTDDGTLRRADKGKGKADDSKQAEPEDADSIGCLPYALGQAIVRDMNVGTVASSLIEAAAFEPLASFPLSAFDNSHTTLAYLPQGVARALQADPQLIAPAVEALITRDTVSVRAVSKMERFLGRQSPRLPASVASSSTDSKEESNVVLTPVKMTKRIYARLVAEHYFPPKVFGRDWQAAVEAYQADLFSSHADEATEVLPDAERTTGRWLDLGAKITCGMEMHYQESRSKDKGKRRRDQPVRMEMDVDEGQQSTDIAELQRSEAYTSFIAALQKMGYFGTELRGSAKWKQLEDAASQQWRRSPDQQNQDEDVDSANNLAGISTRIDKYLANVSSLQDLFKDPLRQAKRAEDDAAWLSLAPEDIENVRRANGAPVDSGKVAEEGSMEDQAEQYAAEQLAAFSSKMNEFLEQEGDYEGARFPDENFEDGDSEEDSGSDDDNADEDMQNVGNSDAAAKAKAKLQLEALTTAERKAAMQDLVEGLSGASWGADAGGLNKKSSVEQKQSGVPQATMKITDESGMEVDAKPIQALSAEEMAALFPIPADAQPITEFGDSSAAEQGVSQQAAATKPSRQQREEVSNQVKHLRSSLRTKQHYDGDSDSGDSLIDAEEAGDSQADRTNRSTWLGLDQDEGGWEDDQEDDGVHMNEEMDDFITFARKALGLSQDQYDQIIAERQARGAFIPQSKMQQHEAKGKDKAEPTSVRQAERPLKTFEEVMDAMDEELKRAESSEARVKRPESRTAPPTRTENTTASAPGAKTARVGDDEEMISDEELSAQDQELVRKLLNSGELAGDDDNPMLQLNMIQNFLESYKAQGGSAGPVSTLAGRLKVGPLPDDQND